MRTRISIIIFIVVAVIFFIILLQFLPLTKPLNGFLSLLTNPLNAQVYQKTTSFSNWISFLFHSRERLSEMEKLKNEVMILSNQVAGLQKTALENETLRQQLDFLEAVRYAYLLTNVIGRIEQSGQVVLILDKGEQDGVRTGLPVVVNNGILTGKILKTEKQKSFLLLSIANESRIAAAFANQNGTSGMVKGEHNLSLKMELIPKEALIKPGDIVITSGLENFIPRGLVIGKIEEITTKESDLFQTAYLQSLYSIPDLQILAILLAPEER